MKISIVYDTMTGTTAEAAENMSKILEEHGHQCQVQSVVVADPAAVSTADLICIGGWVEGLFIILQHPSSGVMPFIDRLGKLSGKKAVVFCTYKLAAGSTLRQMKDALESQGADVVGAFKYRGPQPDGKFVEFATTLKQGGSG